MKKLFILPLLLASFIVTACVEDDSIVKPGESLVEPLNITLSLSQSGERQVDLNKTRPSFSFKIEKSHPFVETTASLSVISAEELGNGYCHWRTIYTVSAAPNWSLPKMSSHNRSTFSSPTLSNWNPLRIMRWG